MGTVHLLRGGVREPASDPNQEPGDGLAARIRRGDLSAAQIEALSNDPHFADWLSLMGVSVFKAGKISKIKRSEDA